MGRWIETIKHTQDPAFEEVQFGDGTRAIYTRGYVMTTLLNYDHTNNDIADWLRKQKLPFNPKRWDDDAKTLFTLTFG